MAFEPLKAFAAAACENIFGRCITDRSRSIPPWPFVEETGVQSFDGKIIRGWKYSRPEARNGTLFVLHGFCGNCGNPGYWAAVERLTEKYGLSAVCYDHRFHGHSDNGIPTFGAAEARDLIANMDHALWLGLPQPFIVMGESLAACRNTLDPADLIDQTGSDVPQAS